MKWDGVPTLIALIKNNMIIKVLFERTEKIVDAPKSYPVVILFGDSYKTWKMQFEEFYRRHCDEYRPVKVWWSSSKWKAWGGLKWCNEASFQEELNREGVQSGEPNNPKPRQYSRMKFYEWPLSKLPK